MNELNNDWVLWASILSIVISGLTAVVYGWKAFKAMDADSSEE